MDLKQQLMAEHSKRNGILIANYIGNDPKRMALLMQIFSSGEYRATQRAAWVLSFIAARNPELLQPYVQQLINLLQQPLHVAVKRNVLRILPLLELPEESLGMLAELCFSYLHALNEPAAVKVFSMSVLYQICLFEPELRFELIPTLEAMIPLGQPAIAARGKRVLAQLHKLGKGK